MNTYKYQDYCYMKPKDVFSSCYQWLSKDRGGRNTRQSVAARVKFWLADGIWTEDMERI